MSLIRKLKRQYERDTRHKEIKDLYAHAERANAIQREELRKEYQQAAMNEDAVNSAFVMFYLFGINLHRLYGFGPQRLSRLFQAVDEEIRPWKQGEVEVQDLRQRLKDETGLDVDLWGNGSKK